MNSSCPAHEHERPLLIGCNSVVWLSLSHIVLQSALCVNTVQNRLPVDHGEIFAEFDKKCVEQSILSLTTFKQHNTWYLTVVVWYNNLIRIYY